MPFLIPPPALQAPPKAPPLLRPPDHPRAQGMQWIATLTTHSGEIPVQQGLVYLDPQALRKALKAPDLKDLPPAEAAWRVYTEARIPIGWRYEALADLGGGYRTRTLSDLYRSHWNGPPMNAEDPELKRFFKALDVPKSMGEWTEYLLDGPILHLRMNGGPWATFRHAGLARATMQVDLALQGAQAAEIRRGLAHLAMGEALEGPRP